MWNSGRVTLLTMFLALCSPVQAAQLVPHRAVYDITMLRSEENSGVRSVQGRIVFEIKGSACAGWATTFRLVNRYDYAESESKLVDVQSTSFETGDGLRLDFQQRQFVAGTLVEETRVKAEREGIKGPGKGDLKAPSALKFDLPAGVLFPNQHQVALIDAAQRGENRLVATLFDGSDKEKTVETVSSIGTKRQAGAETAVQQLKSLPSWPMTVSYYKTNGSGEVPDFQVSFVMFSNGISSKLTLDYGDVVLDGKLTSLELLKEESCP